MANYLHNDNCITPLMTSNTAPSPWVTSTLDEYATYPAYKSFAQDAGTGFLSITLACWLKVFTGGSQYKISSYTVTVTPFNDGGQAKNWTLKGSNDGTNWSDALDTQTDQTSWSALEMKTYTLGSISAPYKYFRISISANNGWGSYTAIGPFELIGSLYIPPNRNNSIIF